MTGPGAGEALLAGMDERGDVVDGDHVLWQERWWLETRPPLAWVLMHPSPQEGDWWRRLKPMLKAMAQASLGFGAGGMVVTYLFSKRFRDPLKVWNAEGLTHPQLDEYIRLAARRSPQGVVVAWGSIGRMQKRDRAVLELLFDEGVKLHCIGVNQDGRPFYPTEVQPPLELHAYEWSPQPREVDYWSWRKRKAGDASARNPTEAAEGAERLP